MFYNLNTTFLLVEKSLSILLTFNVRMLDISNAAGTPYWPNVRYIERSACVTFFSADDVHCSCKPNQTHWGARQNARHSSGSIT
jgi:hypothetical protein